MRSYVPLSYEWYSAFVMVYFPYIIDAQLFCIVTKYVFARCEVCKTVLLLIRVFSDVIWRCWICVPDVFKSVIPASSSTKSTRKINLLYSATLGNTDATYKKTRIIKHLFILYAFLERNLVTTTFVAERSFSNVSLSWTVLRLPTN